MEKLHLKLRHGYNGVSMPIYVYEIIHTNGKAGRRFEVMQKISDKPLKKDPKSGKPCRRVIAAASLPQNRFERTVKKVYGKDSAMTRNLLKK